METRDSPSPAAIEETDFRGKTVALREPARRIVCLIESALSGLYMLGAESRLVGISTNIYQSGLFRWYAALDPRIRSRELPAPGNWDFVHLESVLALRPDLVILWAHQSEAIAALEEHGIPVFGVFLKSREEVYREMLALGRLTGRVDRARELVQWTRQELLQFQESLAGKAQEAVGPRVYFIWAQGSRETSGRGSLVDELIRLAGGRNVAAEIDREHAQVSMEKIIAWNPEVILMWPNDRMDPADIRSDPQWQTVDAVRKGRVHEFSDMFLCDQWTLKFPLAMKISARWIHPEALASLDLEEEQRRVLAWLYEGKL